jgi:DNA-binding protein YbaB
LEFNKNQQKQIERAQEVLQENEQVVDVSSGMIEVTTMGTKYVIQNPLS